MRYSAARTIAERAYAAVLGKLIGVYLGRPFEGWTLSADHETSSGRSRITSTSVSPARWSSPTTTSPGRSPSSALSRITARSPTSRAREIGETWLNYIVENRAILWWGGNGNSTEHTAWLNLKRGIEAPASGSIAVNGQAVAEQIGAQIFIDGWAIVAPGNPPLAARLAEQAAKVSHDGAAVDAAKLWAAMEAEAFVSRDVERLIDIGLAQIPPSSPIARACRRYPPMAAPVSGLARHAPGDRDALWLRQISRQLPCRPQSRADDHGPPLRARRLLAGADDRVHLGLGYGLQRGQCRLSDGRDARPRRDRGGPRLAWADRRPDAHFLR